MGHYVRDHSDGAYAVTVTCLAADCQQPRRTLCLAYAVIDVEGPAFRAYYHPECAPPGPIEPGCNRRHCTRCDPRPWERWERRG